MENYKGYEIYFDRSYYDLVAYRKIGERRFEYTHHCTSVEYAKKSINKIIKKEKKTP